MSMGTLFSPKGFLTYGGAILLVLGLVGIFALNDATQTPAFYLDSGENWAHTGLGIIALAIVIIPGLNTAFAPYYRSIVVMLGIVALFFAVYGFYVGGDTAPNTFGISNLEYPLDDLLHLVVAVWALFAAWRPHAALAR
jgi:hypothetical protein